jgi:hypothetical protein
MKILAILLATIALHGCAGIDDVMSKASNLGVVSTEKSNFDNATRVTVTPTYLWGEDAHLLNDFKLGARWSSSTPKTVQLIISYDSSASSSRSYVSFKGMEIKVDGKVHTFVTTGTTQLDNSGYNDISKTVYTQSRNTVTIPYPLFEEMMKAKECRLRIHSSRGFEDSLFTLPRNSMGSRLAFSAMEEFQATVKNLQK